MYTILNDSSVILNTSQLKIIVIHLANPLAIIVVYPFVSLIHTNILQLYTPITRAAIDERVAYFHTDFKEAFIQRDIFFTTVNLHGELRIQ